MSNKTLLSILLSCFGFTSAMACAGGDYGDWSYYNLFMQEIIDDPVYYPFLRTDVSRFYYSDSKNEKTVKNENIEQWQHFLNINYEDAYYLVNKAAKEDLQKLLQKETSTNSKLSFITPAFVQKQQQALEYLVYAKELEPYMSIINSGNSWYYYGSDKSVADLDYDNVVSELEKRYKSVKNKELKLRYGYQLVRFAHYSRKYETAVNYFNTHVERLKLKPAIYYYALSQMAGAEKGLDNADKANYLFLKVFVNSNDLKESAFLSIKLGDAADWTGLVNMAQNENELNDAYLLLGYNYFTNPLNEIEKITEKSPDAIQAKVLMTRAVNSIERDMMPLYYYNEVVMPTENNKYFPLYPDENYSFVNESLALSEKVLSKAKDKDFWALTTAYLCFLNKNFDKAQEVLNQVTATNAKYASQKTNLELLIDICRHYSITPEVEEYLSTKYKRIWIDESTTRNFIIDVLANRYYMQQDYAKSFLLNNTLRTIEDYPNTKLLTELERFYNKPNKNGFEKIIARNFESDAQKYFNYIWGIKHLSNGDVKKANAAFKNAYTYSELSKYVFGVNISECFDCDESELMKTYYLNDFPYIKDEMNWYELTTVLLKLIDEGNRNSTLSAKANYLVGNFFYNVTRLGYYRHLLRFNNYNGNSDKYFTWERPDIYNLIYFKYYPVYYRDNTSTPREYLLKAYKQANNDEQRARIVFALSKWEQARYNNMHKIGNSYWSDGEILISDRKYFKELMKYRNTTYFNDVKTNCLYFDYYVAHN